MGILDNILGLNQEGNQVPVAPTVSADGSNIWSDTTTHPDPNVIVLCEIGPVLSVIERSYCRGQFDQDAGVFFTSENGPYQILDVARWMQVK